MSHIKLSNLEEGELFRLVRTGNKYRLINREGVRHKVKPIGHSSGLLGKVDTTSSLHHSCYVERI